MAAEAADEAVERLKGVLKWLQGEGDRAKEPRELLGKAIKALEGA